MMSEQEINLCIGELAEGYAMLLPTLADDVEALSVKVGEHLKFMGVLWN